MSIGSDELPDYDGRSVVVANEVELSPPREIGPGDKEFPSLSDGYDIGITLYDLVHHGDECLGQIVTVSGEIEGEFLLPNAFFVGDDALPAISADPRPESFREATAHVIGQVRRLDIVEVEAEFGIDLEDGRLARFEGDIVLLVDTVEIVA